MVAFSWTRRAGWLGRASPGDDGRPRTGKGTRSIAAWPTGARGAAGRAGWPICRPSRSCSRGGWTVRSCAHASAAGAHACARTDSRYLVRARERGGGAPKQGAGSGPRAWPRRPQHPDPHPGGSTGPPPVSAPDRRPAPRPHPGPGRGLDRRAPALPDRRPGLRRRRLPRVAGAAGHQGRGWLKHWRRVATRYDQYAHHCLGFLYWAGAWIWLQSYLNRT